MADAQDYSIYEDDGMSEYHDQAEQTSTHASQEALKEEEDLIGRDEDDMVDEKPRLKSPPRYIPGTKLPPPPTAGPSRSTIASFVTDGRRGPATAGTVTSGMEYGNAVVHNNFKPPMAMSANLPQNPSLAMRMAPLGATATPGIKVESMVDEAGPSALYMPELHWWSSDQDIVDLCARAQVSLDLKDIYFSEHKVNGKSKGIAYIEFQSHEQALAVKTLLDTNEFQGKMIVATLSPTAHGNNPFKTLPKESFQQQSQQQQQPGNRPHNLNRGLNTHGPVLNRPSPRFNNQNPNQNAGARPNVNPGYPQQQQQQQGFIPQQNMGFMPQPPPQQQQMFNQPPGMMGFNPMFNPMMAMGMGGMPGMGMPGMSGFGGPGMMGNPMAMGGMSPAGFGGPQLPGQQRALSPAINPLFFGAGSGTETGSDDGSRKRTRMAE